MTAKWYFQMMDDTVGPLTGGELRERALQGQISPETLVSKDGTDRWVTADRVQGLLAPLSDAELAAWAEANQSTAPSINNPTPSDSLPTSQTVSTKDSAMSQHSVPQTKEYKVLTQKDKWFSGKFDPAKLEEALNAYAEQGWAVKAATTASIPGFGGNRDELIVILER